MQSVQASADPYRQANANVREDDHGQCTPETRRFAVAPQRGYHLYRVRDWEGTVWVATCPGFADVESTPSKCGIGVGRTGRQDAINMLFGLSKGTSPLTQAGFMLGEPGR